MGLDIIALSNVEYVGDDIDDEEEGNGDWYVGDCDGQNDMQPGNYAETDQTECHSFRAGSYSWYNRWRDHLAFAILQVPPSAIWENPENYRGQPLIELINFSDCQGGMGSAFSAKLARDFAAHADRVRQYLKNPATDDHFRYELMPGLMRPELHMGPLDRDWFLEKYEDWQKAFVLGAQSGVVIFG